MTMTPTALKKDETKQTESQAHIIQKPLIIVELCCTVLTSHMRKTGNVVHVDHAVTI